MVESVERDTDVADKDHHTSFTSRHYHHHRHHHPHYLHHNNNNNHYLLLHRQMQAQSGVRGGPRIMTGGDEIRGDSAGSPTGNGVRDLVEDRAGGPAGNCGDSVRFNKRTDVKRSKDKNRGHRNSSGGRSDPGGGWRGGMDGGGHRRLDTGNTNEANPVIRLLVLGGHGVGKSAITVRYLTRRFIGEYKSQIDIIYRQSLQVDGVKVELEIIDVSRTGDSTLPTPEICQCDGFLVVYSVAERETFLTANQLLHTIFKLRPHPPRPPITLLGNKQDLEHSRQVTYYEGKTASMLFGCAFAEVSVAETSEDIVPIFTSLIRRAKINACRCPSLAAFVFDPVICSCSCRSTFLPDNHTCTQCCFSGNSHKCNKNGNRLLRSGTVGNGKCRDRSVYGETSEVRRHDNERTNRKVSHNNRKKLTVRSFSSPLYISENIYSANSLNNHSYRQSPNSSPSRLPLATDRTSATNPSPSSLTEGRDETSSSSIWATRFPAVATERTSAKDIISSTNSSPSRIAATLDMTSALNTPTSRFPAATDKSRASNTSFSRNPSTKNRTSTPNSSPRILTASNITSSKEEKQNTKNDNKHKFPDSGNMRGNLCRSLSSPEEYTERWACEDKSPPGHGTSSVKGSKKERFFSNLKNQELNLSLFSRGRSFMLDTKKNVKKSECSCRYRNKSFKSSGKVEIVTIKKCETNLSCKEEGVLNRSQSPGLHQDKRSSKFSGVKLSRKDLSSAQSSKTETNEHRCSSPLSAGCTTPGLPKKFLFDHLENGTDEDGGSSTKGGRQRKFSVFGVGRALGNFLSKGSLPDLPRATANICDKFGSLKLTLKKRSV
ncbi:uncharacterized protein [Cherax quadricarinatus]